LAAREVVPRFEEIDAERERVRRRASRIAVATTLIVAVLLALAWTFTETFEVSDLVVFGVLPAILGGLAASMTLAGFRVDLREYLLPKTCALLGLRYTGREAALPMHHFSEMRLLPEHDEAKFASGVESAGPDVVFTAAGARLQRTYTETDERETETIWRGLLMAVPAPQRFRARTVVIAERGRFTALLEGVSKLAEGHTTERIELGLGELETGLEILTTDPAEARAILSERAMRRLAEIMRVFGVERTSLGFVEDKVLLAIETDANLFYTGSVERFSRRIEIFEELLADFALLFDFAEGLRDAVGSPPQRQR
jgi:hypothetical protein